ncbi:proline iminopeptidase [SAR116 cluster alpha proteobacterium HIMB100]|nr:proline iminopeptidase [SAR116 cluster alpha proteobacterium HIMB100]
MAGPVHAYDSELGLFSPIKPFNDGFLNRGIHHIYFEETGNPDGIPVMFLHGGPGAGCAPPHRRLFDPQRYRVILMDQRGCGRSEPFASIQQNTTQDLIEDIEALRQHLNIPNFILFGGSWGSTLALAYGVTYPDRCLGFVLRGVFLGTRAEIEWFLYDMGRFFPEAHDRFVRPIPPSERSDLLSAYYQRLTSPSRTIACQAARSWAAYENSCATLAAVSRDAGDSALSLALLEAHYFTNECFMPENHLLDNVARLNHLPAIVVQGRHDVICPPFTAYRLVEAWGRQAQLRMVDDAGHSAFESGIVGRLMRGLDEVAQQI